MLHRELALLLHLVTTAHASNCVATCKVKAVCQLHDASSSGFGNKLPLTINLDASNCPCNGTRRSHMPQPHCALLCHGILDSAGQVWSLHLSLCKSKCMQDKSGAHL